MSRSGQRGLRISRKAQAVASGRGSGGITWADTYHVDEFQEFGLCSSGPNADSAIVGPWSEVLKYQKRINCPRCVLLIAVMKANRLEHLFTTQMEVLVQTLGDLLR